MTKHWCPDVYKGIYIERYNSNQLLVSPCCQSMASVEPTDNFNFVDSAHLTKIREKFNHGELVKECNRCWRDEENNTQSRRQSMLDAYPVPDSQIVLESIDYNATWACNLACIMCDQRFSSTWAKELACTPEDLSKIGRRFNKENSFVQQFDLSNVKRVHFNGGEPLLNNEHLMLLEQLDRAGSLSQTALSYNTNGTQYPTERTLELWSRAQSVILFLSIDGTEDAYEYIRYPGIWAQTADNIKHLKETMPETVTFGFNVTVGCYNIFEVPTVLAWFKEHLSHNRFGNFSDFNCQIAYNFDLKMLNYNARQAAIDYLTPYTELAGLVSALKSVPDDVEDDKWIHKLGIIDKRRGTSWRTTLKVAEYY
jgi:sulfatase maturation enzyme AslB (radical SAM superfamily)